MDKDSTVPRFYQKDLLDEYERYKERKRIAKLFGEKDCKEIIRVLKK